MKKQFVIKKDFQSFPSVVRKILQLIKSLNKNAFFATKNCVILNPINVYGDKSFFTINISDDSYQIIVRKQQWKIPQYATATIKQIVDLIPRITGHEAVPASQDDQFLSYIFPLQQRMGPGQRYFRMHFSQNRKQTSKKIQSNRFCQINGRKIKPVFDNNGRKIFISTSPVLQASVVLDKRVDRQSYIIFKYSIDTKSGNVTKVVQKAWNRGQHVRLEQLQSDLIEERRSFIKEKKDEDIQRIT